MAFHAIGLMSGTSLDGLDICYAAFQKNENGTWHYQILNAATYSYEPIWQTRLKDSINYCAEDLCELNVSYGFYLGEKVKEFIQKYSLKNIDLISSHGHTVFHQPQKKFTHQIGDGRAIKILNDFPVVYDFRSQDVMMNGNGAPLVPIGDQLLFSEYDACLNIGGFSNISFLKNNNRIAFDISPVNIVLNLFAEKLGKSFDENGDLARTGTVDQNVLKSLNEIEFYQKSPPKSLGKEWVSEYILPLLKEGDPRDMLATFTEHAATQVAHTFHQYQLDKVLFTGGGSYNSYFLELIKAKTKAEIVIPSKELIEFKEALIFAFMGVLRINNEINILSSATGSTHNHSSGIVL